MKGVFLVKKRIILLIFFIIIFLIITVPAYALSPSSSKIYKGIDVSEWQGDIDFKKVKESGIEVVYIRAGQGFSYEDAKFETNYEKAKPEIVSFCAARQPGGSSVPWCAGRMRNHTAHMECAAGDGGLRRHSLVQYGI